MTDLTLKRNTSQDHLKTIRGNDDFLGCLTATWIRLADGDCCDDPHVTASTSGSYVLDHAGPCGGGLS